MAINDEKPSISIDISDLVTSIKNGNQNSAKIALQLQNRLAAQTAINTALASSYVAAGGVLISTSAGWLVSVSITSPSTGLTGLCYDVASVANAGSSNAFAIIPSSGFITYNWPFLNGLVVQPSSSGTHTVSVSYST